MNKNDDFQDTAVKALKSGDPISIADFGLAVQRKTVERCLNLIQQVQCGLRSGGAINACRDIRDAITTEFKLVGK